MNHLWQKFVGSKDHNRSALDEFPILYCDSANPTSSHGLSERNMLNLFGILIHASTTQKNICSFGLSLFSCLLTLVYQLIVKSMRAFVHRCLSFLWSVKPFQFRITRRNKLQYLIHIWDWVKAVVFRRSKCNPAFALFYPGVLSLLCQDCRENCTTSYEFLMQ